MSLVTRPIIFDHTGTIRWYIDLSFTGGWTAPFRATAKREFSFWKRKHYL